MPAIVAVVGSQWGDEGKGKLVDALAQNTLCCARFNGGANAGHTLVVEGHKLACHLLPCGVFHPHVLNFIGNGVVLHLPTLAAELEALAHVRDVEPSLRISSRCHLTFGFHLAADTASEVAKTGTPAALGTTRRGIGPSYAAKALRISLRACDLLLPFAEFRSRYLEQYQFFAQAFNLQGFNPAAELDQLEHCLIPRFRDKVVDSVVFLDSLWASQEFPPLHSSASLLSLKSHLVIEGANAAMLDLNTGSYPYCTSSDCLISGVGSGLSLSPRNIGVVVGVAKAYCTRVGEGPFPTELFDETGVFLQEKGHEYGASTGRKRRCGWLDIPMLRYTHALNQFDVLMLTKLDVLSGLKSIRIAVAYLDEQGNALPDRFFPANLKDLAKYTCRFVEMEGWDEELTECRSMEALPPAARSYVEAIEHYTRIPIRFIGVGADRDAIISRE
eukprot:Protomagalhaensia_sp_Gyna_25__5927@NODE_905_length_2436_cov_59_193575_g713_i0_p1_GENE_NODE_905_length_2436_cov_59_193575_g713_i0NODE_905_length_2436_cov_59_193575_g713_i0_p1_ORF_typecomplete_len444_score40_78Adenylsucc_synt/PF00709_21/7_1e141_NODE_905_length_2436_cov_59_193575_g713_i08272158